MREEVISSGTIDPLLLPRSASPPQTPAASSAGASSAAIPANVGSIDWIDNVPGSKVASLSHIGSYPPRKSMIKDACSSAVGSSQPSCRPWERGDLLRRLATFKPTDWFGKPKDASSVACARRGWMNIDVDKIECECCGAQLKFSTSSSCTTSEAANACEAFVKELDVGHKVACPWRENCCADSLVQFPPTPSSALIDGFKDRCDGLLQFLSLPVIALSAIENMRAARSTQIDRFLSQTYGSSAGDLVPRSDNMPNDCLADDAMGAYYQAQKLISLCGWEPRWLPNVQDCEENSAQSARNACSVGPPGDKFHLSKDRGLNAFSASTKDTGKKKMYFPDSSCNSRSPLLDCSLCGATVKIWDFVTVSRPPHIGPNDTNETETKKITLTRGASAASGICGWLPPDEMEKEKTEGRCEATTEEGRSLSNAGVDLNLTMAGGLPSSQLNLPVASEHFADDVLGRDLMIGQPSGSEVGDRAASYESRGPSPRKRSLEEGGSTVDRPQDRFRQADSVEGTVIDRDGDEVDDCRQYSDGPSKRSRSLDIFSAYHPSRRVNSSGAGPSRTSGFDLDIDVNRNENREGSDFAAGFYSTLDSARASSVVAMDTVYHGDGEDSLESVENNPVDADEVCFPSPATNLNADMNDALEFDYSNQAQQSTCVQAAGGSAARDVGTSSTNEGEELLNVETATAHKDRFSIGISGGSVGMGASHEAEIHGNDASVHKTDSVVGDAEPMAEVTENQGQMGESAPGPGLMDEFVPEEMHRNDRHGDSQDVISQSAGRADSGSKIYGSTKADSVESGEKISHTVGLDSSAHPSLSCNAGIYSGFDVSKDVVTRVGKTSTTDGCMLVESDSAAANTIGQVNGENVYEGQIGEFDPIACHNRFCPWVNGNVAAAGCSSSSGSTSSAPAVAPCGWEMTLDALDTFQALGHFPNQNLRSDSAASLYKDEHITRGQGLLVRRSAGKNRRHL